MSLKNRHMRISGTKLAALFERLEERRLMAMDTVQPLPFALEFTENRGEILDKDGEGTGFTRVQGNRLGTQYQPALVDLQTGAGVLKLTTTGTSSAGGSYNSDNTLVNGLETQFNGATSGWSVTTRLVSPNTFIKNAFQQAGIQFGPDQDNYVKFVAINNGGGQALQFIDEQTTNGAVTHALDTGDGGQFSIGSFANISTLDLRLVGDAATGKVQAWYSINGGTYLKINRDLTLSGLKRSQFFDSAARAGIMTFAKNDLAPVTAVFDRFEILPGTTTDRPSVTGTRPANGALEIGRDAFVAVDVHLPTPGAGVDANTLSASSVKLYRTNDRALIPAVLNTSGGGDALVLQPSILLDANTSYTFEVTDELKDTSGASFLPFAMSFTTGSEGAETDPTLAFEKVTLPNASGENFTSLAMGPDGKLYASTIDGKIKRWTINSDGTLNAPQTITSIQTLNQGPRFITGIAFDPASTANNLILWSTNGAFAFNDAPDWSGKITRLSGPDLATATDYVVGLPRSIRDHLTNQLAFSPVDGMLYFSQGSNTAMGAPDNAWGLRPEHMLNAAILRLDTSKITGGLPLDVKTEEGGTYNPFAANAPLTIYASGVRNAYDLLFHSNGQLYVPTNGSAANGATPGTPPGSFSITNRIDFPTKGAYTGPPTPAIASVTDTESDWLFRIQQGKYYGHPNPSRGEFIFNGGNPTPSIDAEEVGQYPVGTQPDRNWAPASYEFGKNYSPNGIIEYKGNSFGGALNGKMLVVRYSGGDDIIVLDPHGPNGDISAVQTGIAGLTHFTDPVDLVENNSSGFIYVSEYGGRNLTLLRPITPGAIIDVSKPKLIYNDPVGGGGSPEQQITIKNTGTATLAFPADGLTILGTDASQFQIGAIHPNLPITLQPGESTVVSVLFNATSTGIKTARLQIKSNDPNHSTVNVDLRGLGTTGTGGDNEPSLQRLLDLYQLPINVGDQNPNTTNMDGPVLPNDEVQGMSRLVKAGNGPVTVEALATFTIDATPSIAMGYYEPGSHLNRTQLLTVGSADSQTVNPTINGASTFDPGLDAFALYVTTPAFQNTDGTLRDVHSEDALNTFDATNKHKFRFYALKDSNGVVVPDAFVVAVEEFNGPYDFQDFVFIIRNVKAAPAGPEVGLENRDGATETPFFDRLIFNKIQTLNPTFPDKFHDTATMRVWNTGTAPLTISNVVIDGPWQLLTAPATVSAPIAAGSFVDLQVKFIATNGGVIQGSMTISTNDADEPTRVVQLVGHWQSQSENNQEPNLQQIFDVFGYATQVVKPGETLNKQGLVERVGDEILSPYFLRVDNKEPIAVRQLAAYHNQGNVATIYAYPKGSPNSNSVILSHNNLDGQSLLPRRDNNGNPAEKFFTPASTIFGFNLDGERSDDTQNAQDGHPNGQGYGHHVRTFVARDRNGVIIPNTYLVTMDYSGINYDYNDNVYLVTNIRPENGPSTPTAFTAGSTGAGINLNWNDNTEPNLAGYNVYRSNSANGTFTKLNTNPLVTSDFLDQFAPVGQTSFYRVRAVDLNGTESANATASALRAMDNVAPGTPTGLSAAGTANGITLDWTSNPEADLAGYNVFRSDTGPNGTFNKLNTNALINISAFTDLNAIVGITSYYRVSAVDSSNNQSGFATTNAIRQATDSTAPAQPVNVQVSTTQSSIELNWNDNAESDLAGYNVYRSTTQNGTYVKQNTNALIVASAYSDTSALVGVNYFYRVTAVDTSNNESTAATGSGIRTDTLAPAAPANLIITGTPSSNNLDWSDNVEPDLVGYNVFRDSSPNGTFTQQLNGALLTSSNFSDTTAPIGVLAYYRVVAIDGSNNVSSFTQGSATRTAPDGTPPAVPTGLSFTASAAGIVLDWADNGEPDLAGYKVSRSDTLNGTYLPLNNDQLIVGSTFTDTTAPSGVTSFYRITAVDTSTNASAALAGNKLNVPAAPTGVSAVATNAQIAINWSASLGAAGYTIERSASGNDPWQVVGNTTSQLTLTDSIGLTAGTTYFYRVTATNASGSSAVSASASSTTAPAAPASPAATAFSSSQINITWIDGAGETNYSIERSPDGINSWAEIKLADANATSYSDTPLAPNTQYFYRIRAKNAAGFSAYTGVLNATTSQAAAYSSADIGNPTPAGSTIVNSEGSSYDVTAGGKDVYDNPDQFRFVYASRTGDFDVKVRVANLTNTDLWTKAGLMARETLLPDAKNAFALVSPSQYRFTSRSTVGGSTTPTGSGAVSYPNTWIRLQRSGNTFTGYSSTNGTTWTAVGSVTIANMAPTLYLGMALTSHNPNALATAQFRELGDTFPSVAPAAPSNVSATATPTQVNLSWTDNSNNETTFRIERSNDGVNGWTEIGTSPANTPSYSDTLNIVTGATYFYRVRAVNGVGPSAYSTPNAQVTIPAAPSKPTAPSNLLLTPVSGSRIDLAWTDNSNNETSFRIERKIGAGGTWATLISVNADVTTYSNTGLSAGATYFYRVFAVNAAGDSLTSTPEMSATTPSGQTPFLGNPFATGALIQAEDFDNGGDNVAILDDSAGNFGNSSYRAGSNVDIGTTTDGTNQLKVGWVRAGEWLEYTISIATAGLYDISARVASPGQGGTFHVEFGGVNKTGAISVSPTGGWETYQTITKTQVQLDAGVQIMRVSFDANGVNQDVGNFNWFRIDPSVVTAPAAPTNVAASATPTQVNLTWTDVSGETLYRIERSNDGVNGWTEIGTSPANTPNYTDSFNIVTGATYFYRVRAENGQGPGAYSTPNAQATIPAAPSKPTAPSNLLLTPVSGSRIDLAWTDNSNNETSFRIERKIGAGGTWGTLISVNPNVVTYSDQNLTAGAEYFYRVFAVNAAGDSVTSSGEVSAMTPSGQTPFLGTPFTTGQNIQAEDFDNGGDNVAFLDDTNGNAGNSTYRTGTNVDIGVSGDGANALKVGWTRAGEWLEYTVNIATAGLYDISARVASAGQGGTFRVEFGGVNKTGAITVPPTGGWELYQTITRPSVQLDAGVQIMRVFFETNGNGQDVGNFNWFRIDPTVVVPPSGGGDVTGTFTGADIGNPGIAGSNSSANIQSYDVTASGYDVQGTSDQFRFVSESRTGDFNIRVRVANLTNTDLWTKAGLMVRDSLAANSRNIFALMSPTQYRFTYRTDTNGGTTAVGTGTPTYPNAWLRMQRIGNTFTSFKSTDGVNWTEIGSVTMAMPDTVFFGMAVVSHNNGALATAQFRDFSLV